MVKDAQLFLVRFEHLSLITTHEIFLIIMKYVLILFI